LFAELFFAEFIFADFAQILISSIRKNMAFLSHLSAKIYSA